MARIVWGVCLIIAVSVAPVVAEDEKPAEVSVGHITLDGAPVEGPQPAGLFGEISETLGTTVGRIEKAAEDESVKALILHLKEPSLGWGKLSPLKSAIGKVRASKKKVYAYFDGASNLDYALATACDEIVMPESGMLTVLGVRAEVTFYKNLFDLVGVKADMLRVGEFKSAAEPYTRTSMSPEFRKEMEELLDSNFELLVNTIAEARKLDVGKVREAIDSGPHSAAKAKELGLIDRVAYEDELESAVSEAMGSPVKVVRKYGKKKVDTDFSGLAGMVKLMELLSGETPKTRKTTKPKVAVIYASGMIMTGKSTSDFLTGESVMGSDTIVEAIREAGKDETVKAVVLRVDSPGGSALASDLIWRALEKLDKPFVASMSDVAASGGYYISMGADRIFAEAGTLTGSIGVVGGKLSIQGVYNKVGITTDVIVRGKHAGLFSMTTPFSESERKAMQTMLNDIYAQFTTKAAKGRKMEVVALEKLARGRVYSGTHALKIGLVDEIGTLDDAIAWAEKQAGAEGKLERLILPKPVNPFDALFGSTTDLRAAAGRSSLNEALNSVSPELADDVRSLQSLQRLAREPAAILPFRLRLK